MKALSLLQPWASLVVMGAKQYETRSWQTKYRGKLLIHASAKMSLQHRGMCRQYPFAEYVDDSYALPLGAIVGMVDLIGIQPVELTEPFISPTEIKFGDYGFGRFAWRLANPVLFEIPIPCAGALSVWDVEDRLLKAGPESVRLFSTQVGKRLAE